MWFALAGSVIAFFLALFLSVLYTWTIRILVAIGLVSVETAVSLYRYPDFSASLWLTSLAMGLGAWGGYAFGRRWNPYTPWRYIFPSGRGE